MKENKSNLQNLAMRYGTFMGVFWIIKFIFYPLGLSVPMLELIFGLATLMVPFYGYYLVRSYRDNCCEGHIKFGYAWLFTTFMFMFAALLVAVAHYVYFRFIDNGFVLNYYMNLIGQIRNINIPGMNTKDTANQLSQMVTIISSMTPIQLVMQLLSQNVLYGALMALPIALFAKK
jgi:hypothetical protein